MTPRTQRSTLVAQQRVLEQGIGELIAKFESSTGLKVFQVTIPGGVNTHVQVDGVSAPAVIVEARI